MPDLTSPANRAPIDAGPIAVVDDDEAFRESLGALLEVRRRHVRLFGDVESFLVTLRSQRFRCVILDVHMPGLSETAAVQAVHRAAPDLPIISVSGRMDPGDRARLLAAGASAFLEKPVAIQELLPHITG